MTATELAPAPAAAESPAVPPQITVIGSLNMDLVSYVPHHPLPGETLKALSYAQAPGGKGANQAVACAKLSRTRAAVAGTTAPTTATIVRMVGAVGADAYGPVLRAHLEAYGVDATGVAVCPDAGSKTGVAIVLVDAQSGQNRIVLSPESNDALRPGQFTRLPDPRPDLLILQLEIPLLTLLQILRAARASPGPGGPVPVLLNAAPALPQLPAEAYDGLAHLVVNETEAAILTGTTEAALDAESGLLAAAATFLARGVQTVLITLGGRGVFYATVAPTETPTTTTLTPPATPPPADDKVKAKPTPRTGLIPAEKTTVVDTTAAGDTFVGAYALEVVQAQRLGVVFDIAAAVRKANHAAAKTVAKKGAQDAIPWQDEL